MTSDEDLDDEDSQERPQQRNAANARERARMRVLSRAFCRLKTTLPWVSMRSWYIHIKPASLSSGVIGQGGHVKAGTNGWPILEFEARVRNVVACDQDLLLN